MVRERLIYDRPTVEFWSASMLDSIEATMSGGGGAGVRYVYLVNTQFPPTGAMTLFGHSALLFEDRLGVGLFSFSPQDNRTSPFPGAIAATVNPMSSFSAFTAACRGSGVKLTNGHMTWYEPFNRAIKLGVTSARYNVIFSRAYSAYVNPPQYDALTYNCQNFCNNALYSAGISFKNNLGYPFDSNIPNNVYDKAVSAGGAISFKKITF